MKPIENILALVSGVHPTRNGWTARCPAHDDKNPSLSIVVGEDERVLLRCHAGCPVEAICSALGLMVKDLFPGNERNHEKRNDGFSSAELATQRVEGWVRREKGPEWKLAASYIYADAAGREVMRVLRFESVDGGEKTFRPIHRKEGGWFVGDPPGALHLYRIAQLKPGGAIWVCEGEKAVDAVVALGLSATTSAHGAGAARRTDWSPLAGRDIVVLPDRDEPGESYGLDVVRIVAALKPPGMAKIVHLPDLPEHGDIVEFIAARHAAGLDDEAIRVEIEQLAAAATCDSSVGATTGDGLQTQPSSVGSVGSPRGESQETRSASGSSVGAPQPPSELRNVAGRGEPVFGEPEPLPNELPSVDRFDPWLLPRALLRWIVDIAERIQCPIDFPAVAAIVGLASVLGRKVGIRPKQCDDWLVVPNLWGALIGRPGIMKTPPLQEATRPLKRLEIAAKEVFEADLARYEAAQMVFEEKKKTVQKGIKKELADRDEDGALAIAQGVIDSEPEKPVRRRHTVNDSTVEKLGEILNENPNGVLALRDELVGLLRNLDKEGQESARAFYLEAWNGTGRFTYDRIGRGTVDIEAAIVSILGSIQPGPLGRYLREAVEGGHGDDGLISRFQLAVWPDVSPEWKNVDTCPDSEAKDRAFGVFTLFDRLGGDDVGAERAANDEDATPFLRFDPQAQRAFDRWRGGLERRLRSGEEHPALESHFAKYRSLIPALALLIQLADGGSGTVGLEPLRKALAWGRYLSSHARRIYAVAVMDDVAAAKRLVARIHRGDVKDGFTEREVYKNDWSGLDRNSVRKAVTVLIEYGWLCSQVAQTEGRSKTVYRINPRILDSRHESTAETNRSSSVDGESPCAGTDTTDGSLVPVGSEKDGPPEPSPDSTDTTGRSSGEEWGEL